MGLTGMKGDATIDGVVVATIKRLAMHLRTLRLEFNVWMINKA
jgi:hypothetical protein